jgi:indolepyruvate ferredoxin oxidoreductase beta subunit
MAAVKDGLNVRVSEIHGMAQRGGAVVSMVRIGKVVLAPTVMEGQADILLGFEPLETLRSLNYTSEKSLVIMNTLQVPLTELTAKNLKYPSRDEIVEKIHRFTKNVHLVDAVKLAKKAGSAITQNVVLLGALAGTNELPMRKAKLIEAVRELVPTKYVDTNLKAFELGYESLKKGR